MRLGAHACRRYWFSQDVTKGRRDYVGPGPLGLRVWFICFSHTCVMMFNSMTSVVIMRGAHESQKQASKRKLLVAPCGRVCGVFMLRKKWHERLMPGCM